MAMAQQGQLRVGFVALRVSRAELVVNFLCIDSCTRTGLASVCSPTWWMEAIVLALALEPRAGAEPAARVLGAKDQESWRACPSQGIVYWGAEWLTAGASVNKTSEV